jgi:hypothetical protein
LVGVDINEARRDNQPIGIDPSRRAVGDASHRGQLDDSAVPYSDIGPPAGSAASVHDETTGDEHIQHHALLEVAFDAADLAPW